MVSDARTMQLRKRAQCRGDRFGFLLPVSRSPVWFTERLHRHRRRRGRKIRNAGRSRKPRYERLLLGKIFNSGLESLIGGEPEVLAQRVIIAVDTDRAGRAEEPAEAFVGNEIGAIEI